VETEVAPLILNQSFPDPSSLFHQLSKELHLLDLQTGESGPIAQAIAGTDIAVWDLFAQRQQQPLWRLLGGQVARFPVYASGINPTDSAATAKAQFDKGHRAFKLKVGFDDDLDVANAREIRQTVGEEAKLMVDANQGWDLKRAKEMAMALSDFKLKWIEEPLPADADSENWHDLKNSSPVQLAGGENLRGYCAYREAIASKYFSFLQPDAGKWGGITGCITVGREARKEGLCYCPHWLGGAVGLLASAHLLTAIGGDGLLEIDSNPNPLRDELVGQLPTVDAGYWTLSNEAGLGVAPKADIIARYQASNYVGADQLK